jgi:predicted transport protein
LEKGKSAVQIRAEDFQAEKDLQSVVEANLEQIFRIRFVASEFSTGHKHGGRIDTLGMDQDGNPVIVEYKWLENQNIINQGLFYLDWLVDHHGDFALAAQKALGPNVKVKPGEPRLILLAQSFSKYDKYAVNRIAGNIELWTYRLYENGLFSVENVFSPPIASKIHVDRGKPPTEKDYSVERLLQEKGEEVVQLFRRLQSEILALSSDTEEVPVKWYVSYKRGRNFCECEIQKKKLLLHLDIPHRDLNDPRGIAQDYSKIGHYGTGETQVSVSPGDDLGYVMGLIRQAYDLTL